MSLVASEILVTGRVRYTVKIMSTSLVFHTSWSQSALVYVTWNCTFIFVSVTSSRDGETSSDRKLNALRLALIYLY